jgi:hypothetical protein
VHADAPVTIEPYGVVLDDEQGRSAQQNGDLAPPRDGTAWTPTRFILVQSCLRAAKAHAETLRFAPGSCRRRHCPGFLFPSSQFSLYFFTVCLFWAGGTSLSRMPLCHDMHGRAAGDCTIRLLRITAVLGVRHPYSTAPQMAEFVARLLRFILGISREDMWEHVRTRGAVASTARRRTWVR